MYTSLLFHSARLILELVTDSPTHSRWPKPCLKRVHTRNHFNIAAQHGRLASMVGLGDDVGLNVGSLEKIWKPVAEMIKVLP